MDKTYTYTYPYGLLHYLIALPRVLDFVIIQLFHINQFFLLNMRRGRLLQNIRAKAAVDRFNGIMFTHNIICTGQKAHTPITPVVLVDS